MIVKPDPPVLYCDASRTFGHPYTIVAGAIASVQKWTDFDVAWSALLAENRLLYFRMSEFAHSVGQFAKGWKHDERRRQDFFLSLVRIVVEHVSVWVGAALAQREFEAADRIYQVHESYQPYTICGLTCIGLAYKWRDNNRLEYLPLEYLFEDGDEPSHQSQLRQRCKEWYDQYPIFRKKLGDPAKPQELFTPLQVGDIAAYEIGKAYSLLDPGAEELWVRFRTSFGLLAHIPHTWGELHDDKIRAEMNMRGVPKRS